MCCSTCSLVIFLFVISSSIGSINSKAVTPQVKCSENDFQYTNMVLPELFEENISLVDLERSVTLADTYDLCEEAVIKKECLNTVVISTLLRRPFIPTRVSLVKLILRILQEKCIDHVQQKEFDHIKAAKLNV